jgi:preprotein translocase subunit SecE
MTEEGEVAERKRRGDDAVDERLDDVLDDDLLDEDLDELDDEALDEDDEDTAGGGVATRSRPGRSRTAPKKARAAAKSTRTKDVDRPGIFARIRNFVREVVAELRKVIWPTRKELLTYTAVVIVFVTIMFTIVAGLDWGFTKAMFWVFGNVKK